VREYLELPDDEIATLLRQANEHSVDWAAERVGNLVTDVSDTTRNAINQLVSDAIRDGETNEELAATLRDVFQFSEDRALLIARTETAKAETMGALIGYRASGVVRQKQWLASPDACDDCAELDEEIVDVDDVFSNGEDGPPDHPNCRCVVVPVVATPAAAETES
jgi:SPP1 gp7 family putative phage head morphogenesis protein